MLAALGIMPSGIAKIDQGVQVGISYCKHMPTTSTVTAIGTAEFFVPVSYTHLDVYKRQEQSTVRTIFHIVELSYFFRIVIPLIVGFQENLNHVHQDFLVLAFTR